MGLMERIRHFFTGVRPIVPPLAADPAAPPVAGSPGGSLPGESVWCVVADVLPEQPDAAVPEIRYGAKHFAPGSKVYVFRFDWATGGDRVTVFGRQRKSRRYLALGMSAKYLVNWRAEQAFCPRVVRQITSRGEFAGLPPGSPESRTRAEEIAARFNRSAAARKSVAPRRPDPGSPPSGR